MGDQGFGIDFKMFLYYVEQVKEFFELGVQVVIVIGGGNIYCGLQVNELGIEWV